MRLIDADKIHPDVRTQRGALAISQGQLAYAETVNAILIPDNATNGDVIKQIFGVYATELWAKPESEFLEWLNGKYQRGGKE